VRGDWSFNDVTSNLLGVTYSNMSGSTVASVTYPSYDENHNLKEETRTAPDGSLLSHKIHSFDALDRLATTSVWTPQTNTSQT
ncbi:hypothetical protein ABTK20_22295, partial [Acinetobacter baumannii]